MPYPGSCSDPKAKVRHANLSTAGAVGAWSTLHHGAVYDYNYAAATCTHGATVWMDVRDAADCPAVDADRQSSAW